MANEIASFPSKCLIFVYQRVNHIVWVDSSQQWICWVSIGGLVTRKCTPRKIGVLEPCWNLSLLGCKAANFEQNNFTTIGYLGCAPFGTGVPRLGWYQMISMANREVIDWSYLPYLMPRFFFGLREYVENICTSSMVLRYPLVICYIAMENGHSNL